jgi:hypothetical protein
MSLINQLVENKLQLHYAKEETQQREDDNIVKVRVENKIGSPSANIWYTLSIVSNLVYDPPNPARSVPKDAILSFTRNSTILNAPDKFRVAVTRLSIPSASIPLLLYPTIPETYTITLSYVPTNPAEPVIQVTRNVTYVASNIGDPYEGLQPIYYYQTILDFVNTAYEDAYNDIVAQVALIGEVYQPTAAPYILYEPQTRLFKLYAQGAIGGTGYLDIEKYGIYMNKPLFDDFFSGFYSREVLGGAGNFNGIQIIAQDYGNNIIDVNGTDFVVMTEQFSSAPLFNKVDRVIVASNMIPVTDTYIATQAQESFPVLLDYVLPDENLDRQRYEYDPKIYRWFDLTMTQPLKNFDVQYSILYEDGRIIRLKINGNQRLDMTLLFTPRDCNYQ